MVSMTEKQKLIYNHFLEVSKKINNKPVKYRKNFDNFPDENYIIINKLGSFFNNCVIIISLLSIFPFFSFCKYCSLEAS